MNYLPCETIETQSDITASVIWLHGLGASGHDFASIVPALQLPKSLGIRFIFPHAPEIPVTINGGMVMPAWYDIMGMDMQSQTDTAGIEASAAATIDLVEREIQRGINSQRIVLAGFSQGGAVAYQAALSYAQPLAGLMALSTYFASYQSINYSEENRALPIHLFHGINDPMVPEAMAKHALAILQDQGRKPEYKTYPMEHEVHPRQIQDISAWLTTLLASKGRVS